MPPQADVRNGCTIGQRAEGQLLLLRGLSCLHTDCQGADWRLHLGMHELLRGCNELAHALACSRLLFLLIAVRDALLSHSTHRRHVGSG